MKTENIINNLIEGILTKNADAIAILLADDVVFYDPMGSKNGRQAVYEMYKNFFGAAKSIEWNVRNKIIDNNIAVIERVNNITLQNGKNIKLPIVTIAEVVDDKIKSVRDYFDFKTFNDQIS